MAAPADAFENAYALLTNIQGFNSFSLSPASTPENIARAFQTQSLIWHPDKNPGDPEALKVYQRMQRAYNTLRNEAARAAHDARIANGEGQGPAAKVPPPPRSAPSYEDDDAPASKAQDNQRPPVDLGAPPPSARPFAYIDKEPAAATPAAKAGLKRGDALLRIGEASHLRDVQGQLQARACTSYTRSTHSLQRL